MGRHYDIAIIGGGIIGRTLAAAIRRNSQTTRLNIALIDSSTSQPSVPPHPQRVLSNYSNRVSSVTAPNFEFLKSLSLKTNNTLLERSNPFNSIRVWDGCNTNSLIDFDSPDNMGYIVENSVLSHYLYSNTGGAQYYLGKRVTCTNEGEFIRILLGEEEEEITCSLVVGADGKDSVIRNLINPKIVERDYDQRGIVATLKMKNMPPNIAYQRFLPTGPMAILPIDQGIASMVWTLPSALAESVIKLVQEDRIDLKRLINCALHLLPADVTYYLQNNIKIDEEEFNWRHSCLEDDQKLFSQDIPEIEDVDVKSVTAFPLKLSIAQGTVGQRGIIIGDAAHIIHPLAGQGMNLGIGDVRELEKAIEKVASVGEDVGLMEGYLDYSKKRYMAVMAMAGFTESIHRVFDSKFPFPWIRSKGMGSINKLAHLKSVLIKASQI